jgi:two-component system OmpR family response regulator
LPLPFIDAKLAPMEATGVLVVEDDPGIRESLCLALESEGYRVIALEDGTRLHRHLDDVDIAIVDVDLPAGPNGLELTRQIRRAGDLPVIILTAAGDLEHKGAGYRAGADQYVAKPFSITELLWQINALLRRAGRRSTVLRVGDLELDPEAHRASYAGTAIPVTPLEFSLLHTLLRNRGRVLSKLQLLDLVWGHTSYELNLVEATVKRLRRKLAPHDDSVIETVRGVGYRVRG